MTITEPVPESTLTGIVTLKAVSSDYASKIDHASFHYRVPGEASRTYLDEVIQQPDDSWTVEWDTASVNDGDCEVGVEVSYRDSNNQRKHNSTLLMDYTIDNSITSVTEDK